MEMNEEINNSFDPEKCIRESLSRECTEENLEFLKETFGGMLETLNWKNNHTQQPLKPIWRLLDTAYEWLETQGDRFVEEVRKEEEREEQHRHDLRAWFYSHHRAGTGPTVHYYYGGNQI